MRVIVNLREKKYMDLYSENLTFSLFFQIEQINLKPSIEPGMYLIKGKLYIVL